MNTEVARTDTPAAVMEKVVIEGDLAALSVPERVKYYAAVCESVGLNPLTKPFEYIKLNNKLTLYAKRDATDQLRAIKGISIQIVARDLIGEIYIVTARATMPGREDESTGAVNILGKKGEDLANAYMKAETKAKRRVTLSIAGLGLLDETEVEDVDPETPNQDRPVVQMPRALSGTKSEPEKSTIDPNKKLEASQIGFIRKKLEQAGVEEKTLLAEFKAEKLEDVPFASINPILAWIGKQGHD